VPKNYVGYICALRTMFDPKASWGWYEIELLGPGLAVSSDVDFIEPGMSVPVFPTSAHPASRVPLQPSRPLPWRSRYHHTLSPTIVACRIANSETHPATLEDTTHLSRQERSRLAAFFDEDLSRNGLLRDQSRRQSQTSEEPLPIATAPSPRSSSESDDRQLPAPTAPLHISELADSLSMNALLSIMRDSTPDTSVVVKASCKLSGSTKLADPKEFLQEEARLKRVVQETQNRRAGHTPDGKERTDTKTAGNPHPLKSNPSPNGHAKVPTSKGYFLSPSPGKAPRTRTPNPSPTTPTPVKSGPKLLPTPTVVLNDGEVTLCAVSGIMPARPIATHTFHWCSHLLNRWTTRMMSRRRTFR
jgi:hypothetical protein